MASLSALLRYCILRFVMFRCSGCDSRLNKDVINDVFNLAIEKYCRKQCSTLDIAEYRARCRTDRAAEYCSLFGPVRNHFTRACSIRLFGSAYQPGVLLGFGARLRFFLQKFTNFVWVLEICIGRHLFPASRLLGGLLDSAARKTVTSIGLFGSTARSTTLATPPCIRFGIRHQNRAERGTLVKPGILQYL